MAKRMTDTEIWRKDWFLDLSDKQKLLVKFLFDNCDCAGVYEISYRTLKFCFNDEITKKDFEGIKQIKFLDENKIFIEDFIEFQYGVSIDQLNEKNNVHRGILKSLNKNNILSTLNQPFSNPSQGVLDKDMVKDKDMDKKDISCNLDFEKCFEIYKENCKNLLPLCFERRSKAILDELNQFLIEIDYNFDYFLNLCKKADSLKKIVDNKIDFRSMIKCHIGITNGKYIPKKEEKPPQTVVTMNYPTAEETRQIMAESRQITDTEEENRKSFEAFKSQLIFNKEKENDTGEKSA